MLKLLHLYPLSNNKYNFASKCRDLLQLGIRSLANASRARQFNPLNPPGVGWVKFLYFFKVRVYPLDMPNLGAVRSERLKNIYNLLNPPGVGGVNFF